MNIKRLPSPRGTKSILTYWYQGIRYRPTIGYNLTADAERDEALRFMQLAHRQAHAGPEPETLTFAEFVPLYEQRMVAKQRQPGSIRRNTLIITRHLVPFFGPMRLRDIRLEHGDAFIVRRRSAGAADGTIGRECAVLSAILNYATDAEYLDKNRLRRMAVPDGAKRTRTASPEEIRLLAGVSFPELTRAITIALNTGLREQRIIDLDEAWVEHCPDGPWLLVPKARTKHKNNPTKIPLNHAAYQALMPDVRNIHGGRIFQNWHSANVLGAIFRRKARKAGLIDLHFHDLRHTFSTALENLGVDTRTIDLLTGHKIHGVGEDYRHGGAGRDKTLRDAVTRLDQHWRTHRTHEPLVRPEVPLQVPPEDGRAGNRTRKPA